MDLLEQSLRKPNEKSEEKLIVMHGPLSEMIYRALNGVYIKGGEESDYDFSLESQAQEAELSAKAIEQIDDQGDETPDYVVFGVDKLQVEPETIIEVKNLLDEKDVETTLVLFTNHDSKSSSDESITAAASNKDGYYSHMTNALESYVQSRGGVVIKDIHTLIERIIN